MRLHPILRALGRTRRAIDAELASRLLIAAMLIPLVEALFGWRVHTPLGVPLVVHASILVAVIALAPSPIRHEPRASLSPRGVLWLPVPLVAIALTVVLNARSNVFYTGRALMDGMSMLLAIHLVERWLRHRSCARRELRVIRPATARLRHAPRW